MKRSKGALRCTTVNSVVHSACMEVQVLLITFASYRVVRMGSML